MLFTGSTLYAQSISNEEKVNKLGAIPFKFEGTLNATSESWSAPPHGLLNLFVGNQLDSIPLGTRIKVIGKKTYYGFKGSHVWYLLDTLQIADKGVWIYGGIEGEKVVLKQN